MKKFLLAAAMTVALAGPSFAMEPLASDQADTVAAGQLFTLNINVNPQINVAAITGVGVAVQVLTKNAVNSVILQITNSQNIP